MHKRYYRLFKKHLKLYDLQKHTTKLKKAHRYAF
ncbi:ISHa1152 transposase B fragment 2 [Helicobacter acinonychis str. Sheeba]|uniref:ISHa1152 transposase B 2 n=1 Tax=Helicobacter acinonychis (strain Sheeba) TaxID=382638 RepID=Q17VW8_HELAH|nr:ISHa1152 transposase B fragment 2 [Helicobacter acinonychis str. Sheeba]